jgi:subtilase family serine protease
VRSTYSLADLTSDGRTVAIVDAYNDPTSESDLATFRTTYGLPACTTASGCRQKMDQPGGRSYPSTNGGRAQEISLDLDMV